MRKTFIEIGTCDFDTLLPLCKNGWKGYFVEPIKKYADFIKKTCLENSYDSMVSNCAISYFTGNIEMYASSGKSGKWSRGVSHAIHQKGYKFLEHPKNASLIERIVKVPCYTLDDYIDLHKIEKIDFLKIDTEGHETDIIENYSWKLKPTTIKLEHKHIDDVNMKRILENNGYIVYVEKEDIYAIQ